MTMKEKRDGNFLSEDMCQDTHQKTNLELINKINPKSLVPIHTENPKLFEDMFPGKVILPKYAQPIEI